MKDIREQILKILLDKIKCSGYTAIEGIPQSTREIESLIKENYVEKEFVEWVQDDCEFWYDMINKVWAEPEPEDKEYSLDELYDYWLKEIKK